MDEHCGYRRPLERFHDWNASLAENKAVCARTVRQWSSEPCRHMGFASSFSWYCKNITWRCSLERRWVSWPPNEGVECGRALMHSLVRNPSSPLQVQQWPISLASCIMCTYTGPIKNICCMACTKRGVVPSTSKVVSSRQPFCVNKCLYIHFCVHGWPVAPPTGRKSLKSLYFALC